MVLHEGGREKDTSIKREREAERDRYIDKERERGRVRDRYIDRETRTEAEIHR